MWSRRIGLGINRNSTLIGGVSASFTVTTPSVMGALLEGAAITSESGSDGAYTSSEPGETVSSLLIEYRIDANAWTASPGNAIAAQVISKRVTVTGSLGTVSTFTAGNSITVSALPNNAPVAVDDTGISTPFETAVSVDVLANDTDADSDTLTVVQPLAIISGTATLAIVSNEVVVTPGTGYSGNVVFSYTVFDGEDTDVGQATITVNAEVVAPPEINSLVAGTQSGGDITHTIDVSEACSVDRVITASASPPTPAQIGAGLNDQGSAAIDATTTVIAADGNFVIALPSTLQFGVDYYEHYSPHDGSGNRSTVVTTLGPLAYDTINPALSTPGTANIAATTADGLITSDEPRGTLTAGLYTDAFGTPTATQLRAGTSAVFSASVTPVAGVNTFNATGLTASTAYRWHYIQDDTQVNTSGVVSGAGFTSAAAGPTFALDEEFNLGGTAEDLGARTNWTQGVGTSTVMQSSNGVLTVTANGGSDCLCSEDGVYAFNREVTWYMDTAGTPTATQGVNLQFCSLIVDEFNYYGLRIDHENQEIILKRGFLGNIGTAVSFATIVSNFPAIDMDDISTVAVRQVLNGGGTDLIAYIDGNEVIGLTNDPTALAVEGPGLHTPYIFNGTWNIDRMTLQEL